MDYEWIKQQAVGRWPGIFQALGIKVRDDGRHGPCPTCGGDDRFRFDNKDGNGTFFCNNCGAGDGWTLLQKVLGCGFKEAAEQVASLVCSVLPSNYTTEKSISPEILRKMFVESVPASKENLVGQYLSVRGLNICPASLRYHKKVYDPDSKKDHPAMLAVVTTPDGTAATMHRTYLDVETAGKAKIDNPKKLMPGVKKISGGAIRLMAAEAGVVGVAEGIETALACYQHHGIPTWATVSSTMMGAFVPPVGIKKVYVFGDNDRNFTGQAAAFALGRRLVMTDKIEAEVVIPPESGDDWLDHMNRG